MPTERKRRNHWGSIRQGSNGSWQLRYPSLDAEGEPGPRRSLIVKGSREDAVAVLKHLEKDYRSDQRAFKQLRQERCAGAETKRNMTMDQLWRDVYRPKAEASLSPLTMEIRTSFYNLYIHPVFGKLRVRKITHALVQDFLNQQTHTNAKKAKSLLHILFCEAQNERIVKSSDNVLLDRYSFPPPSKNKKPSCEPIYKSEEVDEILSLCKGEPFEGIIILMSKGGARLAEACGARFSDMTFSSEADGEWCRVRIERNAVLVSGETIVKETKNPRSKRTIFIPEPYSKRLREMAEQADRPEQWVSDDGTGVPLVSGRLSATWRNWARKNYAGRYVPIMYFRDTFATDMHNKGMDPFRIAQLLGHSNSSQMLYKHYDRPDDDALLSSFADACRPKEGGLDPETKEMLVKLISKL